LRLPLFIKSAQRGQSLVFNCVLDGKLTGASAARPERWCRANRETIAALDRQSDHLATTAATASTRGISVLAGEVFTIEVLM
jgi:hypothetical protein